MSSRAAKAHGYKNNSDKNFSALKRCDETSAKWRKAVTFLHYNTFWSSLEGKSRKFCPYGLDSAWIWYARCPVLKISLFINRNIDLPLLTIMAY